MYNSIIDRCNEKCKGLCRFLHEKYYFASWVPIALIAEPALKNSI